MADIFTREQRSKIMRQVKSRLNKSTELKLISFFKSNKINGWRRNYHIFGKPDFVFPAYNIAIFVDGCFWHGHNCRNITPKDNADYWSSKIERNKKRDKDVVNTLQMKNWTVIRLWECELKNEQLFNKLAKLLQKMQEVI
ncbi:MAG: very short patch repair endonuclease [Campylobacteraceae bacterium]|jgi:DNA mismatch endonuclease (patch repair protein)|nr:very short patch repair endonuclease [Campylobacteraceae bacterium]